MIKDIANIMKNELTGLYHPTDGVITALAGLTRVREISVGGEVKQLRRIPYPVDCGEDVPDDCPDKSKLFVLVPDTPTKTDSKRCIVYFEGGRVTPLSLAQGFGKFSATISLICWFDARQYQPQEYLTTTLINLFKKKIDISYAMNPTSVLSGLDVITITPNDSDPSIFTKYTYSDFSRPYLGCPFGYFKIDFFINFTTNENCAQIPIVATIDLCK